MNNVRGILYVVFNKNKIKLLFNMLNIVLILFIGPYVFAEKTSIDEGINNPQNPISYNLSHIEKQQQQEPKASIDIVDLISDGMCLVPLNDWVPLFRISMTYPRPSGQGGGGPAYRVLTRLKFVLTGKPKVPTERDKLLRRPELLPEDILEFGIFVDSGPEGRPDDNLDLRYDGRIVGGGIVAGVPMLKFDRYGYPYALPDSSFSPNNLVYSLSFVINPQSPDFPPIFNQFQQTGVFPSIPPSSTPPQTSQYILFPFLENGVKKWLTTEMEDANISNYIIAVRISYNWKNYSAMRVKVLDAPMQYLIYPTNLNNYWEFGIGEFPLDNQGKPLDSYSPNFYGDTYEFLDEGNRYDASFNVYDLTSGVYGYKPGEVNNSPSWTTFIYTPYSEHFRPRWDISNTFIEGVLGEWIDFRFVWPIDAWIPVLGINAHGNPIDLYGNTSGQISEVNIILTDVGGDPFGPPGNGGFNPNYALESMNMAGGGFIHAAYLDDYAFNGVWVYHDTNEDGVFQAPEPLFPNGSSFGVKFTDYPMEPDREPQQGEATRKLTWEYIPFPPGGGDPWWKIRIKLRGGRNGPIDLTPNGYLEPIPDYYPDYNSGREYSVWERPDYFVVIRTNSGKKDVSGLTAGASALFGGDFKAFIEPRRWNPMDGGHWDGGIWFSNMYLDRTKKYYQDTLWIDESYPPNSTSQSNRRLHQPWWHERSHTQDNVKAQRIGFEIHDLVLTYSTDNNFGRETYIHPTQVPPATNVVSLVNSATPESYALIGTQRITHLSLWKDPPISLTGGSQFDVFGIFSIRYLVGLNPPNDLTLNPNINTLLNPNIARYYLFNPAMRFDERDVYTIIGIQAPIIDYFTDFQYAFETVPFEPDFNDPLLDRYFLAPRSTAYPKPFIQPTLPDYATWPMRLGLTNFGFKHIVYADPASLSNNVEYYHFDPSEDPNVIETWQGVWATYKDDIFYAELLDGNFVGVDLSGWWLIDSMGGRFYILSNVGNVLKLERGHSAYQGPYLVNGNLLNVPQFPYGIPTGKNNAVERGAWLVTKHTMSRDRFPQMADWPLGWGQNTAVPGPNGESRAARILRQKVEINSLPTAMLGINIVGADDPVVNRLSPVAFNSITVAFWGPEFDPSDLQPLDNLTGRLPLSGVMLYEDTNNNGVFDGLGDQPVPLIPSTLQWETEPEPIDLDGDNIPDDLSGDGIVTNGVVDLSDPARPPLSNDQKSKWDGLKDLAWVLKLIPLNPWEVPQSDVRDGLPNPPAKNLVADNGSEITLPIPMDKVNGAKEIETSSFSAKKSLLIDLTEPLFDEEANLVGEEQSQLSVVPAEKSAKALPRGGHLGDDLFVVIRTTDMLSAHEEFRCVVPARLPNRSPITEQFAGIVLTHGGLTSRGAVWKSNPEEASIQDFYGHDMLQASVPTKIVDVTSPYIPPSASGISIPVITPGGQPLAVLGIDASTNRPSNLIAYGNGTGAQSSNQAFTPSANDIIIPDSSNQRYFTGGVWSQDLVGLWLIAYGDVSNPVDKRVEAFEITGVQGRRILLRAGTPLSNSPWQIVKDPTFLEQVIVEFYSPNINLSTINPNLSGTTGDFNPYTDLLPLDYEDPANGLVSGVSIWRDNDWDPRNTNGVFDPPIIKDDGTVDYIDLPLRLDGIPVWYSRPGDPRYQVRFVFSSPGTDNSIGRDASQGGTPYVTQPRNRQPIPNCFGICGVQDCSGPDFFVVIRTSPTIQAGDAFQVAIVSFGPDTPTEPDPDNFIRVYPGSGDINDGIFALYSEFPWGNRGIGYISFFKEKPIYRYWAYDDRLRKWTARAEPDVSQDPNPSFVNDDRVRLGLHWIRTNPVVYGRSNIILALAPPSVDFTSDRQRQAVGGNIRFTLLPGENTTVTSVLWNFGDGNTSTAVNPTHSYSAKGVYSVSVEIKDKNGLSAYAIKRNYIEIVDTPYVAFSAVPRVGRIEPDPLNEFPPGLDVQFTDQSMGDNTWQPVEWVWNFGDSTQGTETKKQNPLHRYLIPGNYTVSLEVTFRNVNTGETIKLCHSIANYIRVLPLIGPGGEGEVEGEGGGEGEAGEEPSASFSAQIIIKDKEALLPLTDWVPLFNFVMGYDPDNSAPRVLKTLIYRIRADKRRGDELGFGNLSGPNITDILEFGLFKERFAKNKEEYNNQLDPYYDELLYRWRADGSPIGQLTTQDPLSVSGLTYRLNFIGNGTARNPEFPVVAGPRDENGFDGNSYIVAVRTSATWRSQLTLSCDVLRAEMVKPNGIFPRNADGEPIDEYDPNFFDADDPGRLIADTGYSSSFAVWDLNGLISTENWQNSVFDAWNYPVVLYTPVAEHTRPKWSKIDELLYMYAGELLSIRRLLPMDTWKPVIGINVHSTKSVHADAYDPLITSSRVIAEKQNIPQLREVNVIFTDIGADPYGPPGNGGFDPREGLDKVSTQINGYLIGSDQIFLQDIVFNGVWVWHDTNNNGKFDPPTQLPTGGIQLNGDYPLLPEEVLGVDLSEGVILPTGRLLNWEYIPFPPGGGDPWWKINLRFFAGRRRFFDLGAEGDNEGFVEAIPDNYGPYSTNSEYSFDYFVVIRTDSGYKDVALTVPDRNGITMGADFRVFIEPRRIDNNGVATGGIYVDSQIPPLGGLLDGGGPPWQTDPRWGAQEPWWPQRTVNDKSTKPIKVGIDVHDLILVYTSDSPHSFTTDLFFGAGSINANNCLGFTTGLVDYPKDFDKWMDPEGKVRSLFLNRHSVGVTRWRLFGAFSYPVTEAVNVNVSFDYTHTRGQYAYETVPFDHVELLGPDTRSSAYVNPMDQPTLPDYTTWTRNIGPNEYPRASQWKPEHNKARLLYQKADIQSEHIPMLGINLVGSGDIIVNSESQEPPSVAKIVVAFWGPEFSPDILMPLVPDGNKYESGVLLWEDADKNGVFFEPRLIASYWDLPTADLGDKMIPLNNLRWGSNPEPIDIDGDGRPDDMNGDGFVDQRDYAWVLTLYPKQRWSLPTDDYLSFPYYFLDLNCGTIDISEALGEKRLISEQENITHSRSDYAPSGEKQLEVTGNNPGDDLFITVRLNEKAKRFQAFRAVIPANLPARSDAEKKAGIQFYPEVNTSSSAFIKSNPEEDPVQDFYGHDMLEINVPVQIYDFTNQSQTIIPGGPAVAVMGFDISTNRPEDSIYQGRNGVGAEKVFTITEVNFEPNSLIGDFLIDSRYESYEIVGNTTNQLYLLSGTPRSGPWRIERNPTFLEELAVEFYNEGTGTEFNPLHDLLPLNIDCEVSGVSIFRDNDNHPSNRNGLYDPDIDIPVPLDAVPMYIGRTGEVPQVKFVFSSPGTDDVPIPRDQQPRNRQWVPTTFGINTNDPFYGPDFFIVIRASQRMKSRVNFRIGMANWGPNTPTEPDPDTWARLSGEQRNDFTKFREFPWAIRGLGFITYFKTPPVRYYMDGPRAGAKADNSGVNWLRSHCTKKRRTGVITSIDKPLSSTSIVIDSVSVPQLPAQILPGQEFTLVIYGKNFGTNPIVRISNYQVRIVQATDNAITVAIQNIPGVVPVEPIVLIVRNTQTNEEISRSDLLRLTSQSIGRIPEIYGVVPAKGTSKEFPVTILGANFSSADNIAVYFANTLMPVQSVSADGTSIIVGFPLGGIPTVGPLDVTVKNVDQKTEKTLVKGFEYINDAQRNRKTGFLGCGPTEKGLNGNRIGDFVVIILVILLLVLHKKANKSLIKVK